MYNDEKVVILSDDYRPIGFMAKSEVHTGQTPLHLGFSVFLFDLEGNVLLQRRSDTKRTWPGYWSNSCCGHPRSIDSIDEDVTDRISVELGCGCTELSVVLPRYRYRYELEGIVENELCPVLVGLMVGDMAINPHEVSDVRWIDWDQLVRTRSKRHDLSPWCREETELLDASSEFQDWMASVLSRQ